MMVRPRAQLLISYSSTNVWGPLLSTSDEDTCTICISVYLLSHVHVLLRRGSRPFPTPGFWARPVQPSAPEGEAAKTDFGRSSATVTLTVGRRLQYPSAQSHARLALYSYHGTSVELYSCRRLPGTMGTQALTSQCPQLAPAFGPTSSYLPLCGNCCTAFVAATYLPRARYL